MSREVLKKSLLRIAKMKFTFTLLLFFLAYTCLLSQNKVLLSGEIKDQNGNSISPVMVAIEKTTMGTYCDNKGFYSLSIFPGKNTVTVSAFGYKTIRKEIEVKSNQECNFILEEQSVSLNTVEIHGKTKNQQVREGVFSVNAVDIKSMVNIQNNLSAIVGRSNGIRIREDGGLGADFDLSINGLSGNSVRYFIDGVPISSMGSGVTLANLPINIVDRIEIYKGVVPVDLGSDALGGAINIITNKKIKKYVDASYGIGSFNTHKADFNAQYIDEKTGLVIRPTFGFNYSKNNYKMKGVEVWDEASREYRKTDVKRFHDDYSSILGQLELGVLNKKWADAFFILASYSSINSELQTGSIQSVVYGKAERENESFSLSAQYKKKDFVINKLSANLSLSYTWDKSTVIDTAYRKYRWDGSYIETSRNEITGRSRSIRHIKRPLTILRTNFDYTLNSHHTFNLNYLLNNTSNKRSDEIDTDFEPSNDILSKQILGLSYNQSFLNDKLNNTFFVKDYANHLKVEQQDLYWITGSKDEAGSSSTNDLGYGMGSRYRFFETFSLKASFEHSVRLPLAREYLGNGTTVYPNFKLKPENSNNLNLGLFGTTNISPKHSLSYETNFFIRKVQDYIHLIISEAEGMSQYDNVKSVTVKGLEGELRYDYNNTFQAVINCSYLDEKNKTKYQANGKPDITYDNKMPNRPWFFSNLELNFRKKNPLGKKDSQFQAAYFFQYVHWFYLTWEGYGSLQSKSTIPTQCVSNIVLAYSFQKEKYNIALECNNLFDRITYDNFMLQKPGRSLFCKFRLFIN